MNRPKEIGKEEGSSCNACISLGKRNRIDFMVRLCVGGDGSRELGIGDMRWRERECSKR